MGYRNDGEGLHRSVDPADGRAYVYGMSFMDAAPMRLRLLRPARPQGAVHPPRPRATGLDRHRQRARPSRSSPGEWELGTTPPLSTYFVTLVAGPYHVLRDDHDGIPLGLSARASIAKDLDADADDLFTVTRQCFDEFHRLFGIRYAFGDYHQAFVPEFNAGAMENPGCVTFRDTLVFTSRVTRGVRIQRATTVAHEMAHQWFGNLTTPVWWDDLWLNESFAEYIGVRVTADVTTYDDAWVSNAYARRQWGLVADRRPSTHPVAGNGADDAATALQNFDGISYTKGSASSSSSRPGSATRSSSRGTVDHFESHLFGNATMDDLMASWERAGGGDLSDFESGWLARGRASTLSSFDRATGTVRRVAARRPPGPSHPRLPRARRRRPTAGRPSRSSWATEDVALAVPEGAAVLLDPYEDTWAVPHLDDATVDALARAAAGDRPTRACARARGTPCSARSTTAGSTPSGCSTWPRPRCRRRPATTAFLLLASRVGFLEAVAAPTPTPPAPGCTTRRWRAAGDRPGRLGAPAGGVPAGRARAPSTSPRCAAGSRAGRSPRASCSTSTCAGSSWCRLAELGATDRDELARQLADDHTAVSHVEHVKAVTSLPDAEAKAFAWTHFTGELDVPNYELEAAGRRAVAARPGASSPRRTSSATSPRSPAPPPSGPAGCWPRPPGSSSRSPR